MSEREKLGPSGEAGHTSFVFQSADDVQLTFGTLPALQRLDRHRPLPWIEMLMLVV